MAYQALYRVWRSQRFDDVVGQKAVTQTLKNAIIQNKISHAYLFTGPRGTGKTSAAKIFSKAVNCHHLVDGEPCNECETCRAITAGSCNDVIEIDAASNNGVEEIRDIREKVKYAPTQADYKVYIIDEVHMLSTGAFNALLKTLEEPPKNVIFILATTEPHKIPLTIISRTQRFDFKRISTQDIVDHLAFILNKLTLSYEDQALYVIARAAEGGMRDALSILDQGLSFCEETLTVADAMQVTGSLTYEMMDHYLSACVAQETEQGLETLETILNEGREGNRFLEDLLLYCRDLLMYQQAPNLLLNKSGQLTETFKKLAEQINPTMVYQYIKILSDAQKEIRMSTHPTIYLEVATVKLTTLSVGNSEGTSRVHPADLQEVKQLQQKIVQIEKELTQLKARQETVGTTEDSVPVTKTVAGKKKNSFRLPKERVYQVLTEATREHLIKVKEVWSDLLNMLTVTQRAMLKASEIVAASSTGMVLSFDYEILCTRATEDEELQVAVRNGLVTLIQYEPQFVCIPSEYWGGLRKEFLQQNQGEHSIAHTTVPSQEEEQKEQETPTEQVVDEAVQLFGQDFVEVRDD